MLQFGFGSMFSDMNRQFEMRYFCYSVSMLPGNERQDVERGGKILMPPSALAHLERLNIENTMIFKLTNTTTKRVTHCGVLEFIADEKKIYLPHWMMHNLALEEGAIVLVESVSLPVATFSRFQPLSVDFLDITNPKAVLENGLRYFACLTTDDVIAIKYNSKVYELRVLETKPGNAVTIIECDMNVEFVSPVGYQEREMGNDAVAGTSQSGMSEEDLAALMPEPRGFIAFKGEGNRLDGKKKKQGKIQNDENSKPKVVYVRGIPDYDYRVGTLRFIRNSRPVVVKDEKEESEQFEAFKGKGFTLRNP